MNSSSIVKQCCVSREERAKTDSIIGRMSCLHVVDEGRTKLLVKCWFRGCINDRRARSASWWTLVNVNFRISPLPVLVTTHSIMMTKLAYQRSYMTFKLLITSGKPKRLQKGGEWRLENDDERKSRYDADKLLIYRQRMQVR